MATSEEIVLLFSKYGPGTPTCIIGRIFLSEIWDLILSGLITVQCILMSDTHDTSQYQNKMTGGYTSHDGYNLAKCGY